MIWAVLVIYYCLKLLTLNNSVILLTILWAWNTGKTLQIACAQSAQGCLVWLRLEDPKHKMVSSLTRVVAWCSSLSPSPSPLFILSSLASPCVLDVSQHGGLRMVRYLIEEWPPRVFQGKRSGNCLSLQFWVWNLTASRLLYFLVKTVMEPT